MEKIKFVPLTYCDDTKTYIRVDAIVEMYEDKGRNCIITINGGVTRYIKESVNEILAKIGDCLVNGEDKRLDDCTLVEIGPCKDCKRYNKNEMFCTWHSGYLMQKCDPDYYCKDFERRE